MDDQEVVMVMMGKDIELEIQTGGGGQLNVVGVIDEVSIHRGMGLQVSKLVLKVKTDTEKIVFGARRYC